MVKLGVHEVLLIAESNIKKRRGILTVAFLKTKILKGQSDEEVVNLGIFFFLVTLQNESSPCQT